MPLISLGSSFAARTRGPHWLLSAEEIVALSAALAGVAVYIPLPDRELGVAVALSNLATTMFIVLAPRIQQDAALRELRIQQAAVSTAEQVIAQAHGEEGPRQW